MSTIQKKAPGGNLARGENGGGERSLSALYGTPVCQPCQETSVPAFKTNAKFYPVASVTVDGTTYVNSHDGGWFDMANLRVWIDRPYLHVTGFRLAPNGKYFFWRFTHVGPFTVVWELGEAGVL